MIPIRQGVGVLAQRLRGWPNLSFLGLDSYGWHGFEMEISFGHYDENENSSSKRQDVDWEETFTYDGLNRMLTEGAGF